MKIRKILFIGTYINYFLLAFINNLIISKTYEFLINNIWMKSIQTTIFIFFSLALLIVEAVTMHKLKSVRTIIHIVIIILAFVHLYISINWMVITMIHLILMMMLLLGILATKYEDEVDVNKRVIAFNYTMSNLVVIQLCMFSVIKTNLMYIPLIIIILYYYFIKTIQLKKLIGQRLSNISIVTQYIAVILPIIGWYSSTYTISNSKVIYDFYIFPILFLVFIMYFSVVINRKLYFKSIGEFRD